MGASCIASSRECASDERPSHSQCHAFGAETHLAARASPRRTGGRTPTKTRETRTSVPCPCNSAASTFSSPTRGAVCRDAPRAFYLPLRVRHASDGSSSRVARSPSESRRDLAAASAVKATATRGEKSSEAGVTRVRKQIVRHASPQDVERFQRQSAHSSTSTRERQGRPRVGAICSTAEADFETRVAVAERTGRRLTR